MAKTEKDAAFQTGGTTEYSDTQVLSFLAQSKIGGVFQARMEEGFPLLYANDCYYHLHGYTRQEFEELLGNRTESVVLTEDLGAVSAQIDQAIAKKQESLTLEYRVRKKDGTIAWLHASAGFSESEGDILLSGMVINIDERKNFEQRLVWSEKRFQIAMKQTRINVWEYDLRTRSIVPVEGPVETCGWKTSVSNVPDSQISQGIIHPEDAQKYSSLYRRLHNGEKNAEAVVRIRHADDTYTWEKINYTAIFNEDGKPVRAVAVAEDISAQKEAEQRCFQEEFLREMFSADMLLSAKVNLTQDRILFIWSANYPEEEYKKISSYAYLLEVVAGYLANKSDKKRFYDRFSPDALKNAIAENKSSLYGEYRYAELGSHIVWCALRLSFMRDPVSGEQLGVLYIRNIDERKKTELALRERAEKDALTGLYNRSTLESMIRRRIDQQQESDALCALFFVDVDDLKQINDTYGHLAGDYVLTEVGRILRENLGGMSIAGRIGGDEFVIFSDGLQNHQEAHDIAARLYEQLDLRCVFNGKTMRTPASIGLVTSPCRGADFKALFCQADAVMYGKKFQRKSARIEGTGHYLDTLWGGCVANQHLGTGCMIDMISDPVLVIDETTYDMLFMNKTAVEVFGIEAYAGKKCYDVLQGYSHPCVFCQSHLPNDQEFKTWENFNSHLRKRFMIRDKIVQWDGRPARLEIFTDLSFHEEQISAKARPEQVLLECVSSLLATQELEPAIQGTLQRVGEFYQATRAYFARTKNRNSVAISQLDWHSSEAIILPDENIRVESSELSRWLEGLKEQQVVVFDTLEQMRDLFPIKYAILKEKGVVSFAAVAIIDENGLLTGYLGMENPRSNLENTTLLKSLSHFLHNEISKRNMAQQLAFMDKHDPVTGLFNWKCYSQEISQLQPALLSSIGILIVDIHSLHLINQKYGIPYGDNLLRRLAFWIREYFPKEMAFRLSGDSILVLCKDLTYKAFGDQIGRLRKKMDEEYPDSVILGSSWMDEDINQDLLFNRARDQLTLAKQARKERVTIDSRLQATRLQRLHKALADRHFRIYLQPKASVSSGKLYGAEALVRYFDDQHGVVPPIKFIPQLEADNTIRYIDFFVFEEVCAMLSSWKQAGLPVLPVSLNFSRCTLMECDVVTKIDAIADRYGVDHSLLEIEITESTDKMERQALMEICQQIIHSGYRLLLDDFGVEYSSISILAALPLNGLKFDKSVINDLYSNQTTRLLVKNLIQVCREIGIDSIAEGVEELEQLEILKTFGCTYVQGYLYNKPIPVREFERKYLKSPMQGELL